MKSILVIERDGPLQKILKRLFSSAEEYDAVADGTAGLEMLRQRTQVAVILDIERPVNSECDLCKKIAISISNTQLVILSANSDAARQGPFEESVPKEGAFTMTRIRVSHVLLSLVGIGRDLSLYSD